MSKEDEEEDASTSSNSVYHEIALYHKLAATFTFMSLFILSRSLSNIFIFPQRTQINIQETAWKLCNRPLWSSQHHISSFVHAYHQQSSLIIDYYYHHHRHCRLHCRVYAFITKVRKNICKFIPHCRFHDKKKEQPKSIFTPSSVCRLEMKIECNKYVEDVSSIYNPRKDIQWIEKMEECEGSVNDKREGIIGNFLYFIQ